MYTLTDRETDRLRRKETCRDSSNNDVCNNRQLIASSEGRVGRKTIQDNMQHNDTLTHQNLESKYKQAKVHEPNVMAV